MVARKTVRRKRLVGIGLSLIACGLLVYRWMASERAYSAKAAGDGPEAELASEALDGQSRLSATRGREEAPTNGAAREVVPVLRVSTWSGQPVAGAVVTALTTGRRVGVTGSTGELPLDHELGSGEIAVTADDMVAVEARLPLPLPPRSVVQMERGAQISGVVLDVHGLPLGAGVNVMAVNPLYHFNDRALGLTLSGSPLIPLVQTDENGTFVLRGLDPDQVVRLFCAGKGHASFDQGVSIAPGPNAYVEIRATPVFGVLLTFRDAKGREPRLAPMEGRWGGSSMPATHADPLFATRWTERLLGLENGCNGPTGYYDKTLFYTVHEDQGESILLHYRSELPGYSPLDVAVEAGRALGCLRHQEVLLEETCDGFGDVAVVLDPPFRVGALQDSIGPGRECKLRLREVPSGKTLDVRLKSLVPAGLEVVQGIPHGDYTATVVGPHQLFSYPGNFEPAINLRVGTEPAIVRVELPATGTLELKVWRPDGSAYQGPLAGSQLRVEGDLLDAFYFSSGPYRIPLLPTGDYRIFLDNLFPGDDQQAHARTVFIPAKDETTTVEWHLRR